MISMTLRPLGFFLFVNGIVHIYNAEYAVYSYTLSFQFTIYATCIYYNRFLDRFLKVHTSYSSYKYEGFLPLYELGMHPLLEL